MNDEAYSLEFTYGNIKSLDLAFLIFFSCPLQSFSPFITIGSKSNGLQLIFRFHHARHCNNSKGEKKDMPFLVV